jgi:hypothetical protein
VMKPKSEIISVAAKHVRRSTTHSPAAQTNVHIERVIGAGQTLSYRGGGLRVLYTTGNCVTDKLHALFAVGTHFLPKPYTEDQLGVSVQSLLAA